MLDVLNESGFSGLNVSEALPRAGRTPPAFDVSISVGLAGELKGFMFLQAERDAAVGFASEIGRLMDVSVADEEAMGPLHRAALAELTNQVSGRATIYLSEMGYDTDITPPTVLTGTGVSLAVPDGLAMHDARLSGPAGSLHLVVGLVAG